MSDKVELKIVKEIRQNNKPYAGKEISDKKGPVIEGEKSIPGYLLALTSVIDFLMGVEDLHAQDYKKVDVKKLEEFSVSEDNNPDKSLTFNIKRN